MSPEQRQPLLTSPGRLQKIDQLREKNIGTYLPLPQLVAVGDQSSGKSSLLESLSGIPFPRGQEICTRYATQISHRREADSSIDITIIPSSYASEEHKQSLSGYSKQLQTTSQLQKEFPSILTEVNALMDIRSPANPDGDTFSEDVLKIEKCGPNEDYLTIIDVPGIFRNITEGVTTERDKLLVKKMVKRYIKDERTIILAVLPCNVDVATQEILTMAKEVDPTGDRTVGILTTADLLIEKSAKASVVSLVAGHRAPLKLGYHVVTNRGGDDYDEEDDNIAHHSQRKREAMFLEHPWRTLPDDRVGIDALRERLSDLLGEITDRAFPQLRNETREKLAKAEAQLAELGISRKTERQQQRYLVGIASEFQALVRAALNADYSAHQAFSDNELRLITAVVEFAEEFDKDFRRDGHTYSFEGKKKEKEDDSNSGDENAESESGDQSSDDGDDNDDSDDIGDVQSVDAFPLAELDKYPDLSRIVGTDWDVEDPKSGIMEWIGAVYHRSRGLELGTVSPGILASVFREQSAKWETIAREFVSYIILLVHQFIIKALDVVCTDKQVYKSIVCAITKDLCDSYQSGIDHVKLLADIERQLKPYTLNHYFAQNQPKRTGSRLRQTLKPMAWVKRKYEGLDGMGKLCLMLDDVTKAATNKSNADQAKEAIHDTLQAYYKVAYKRFVDNVFTQAVDYKLLSGPNNPLGIFCDKWVLDLDADQLQALAGESRRTRESRDRLQKEVEDLELALKILL